MEDPFVNGSVDHEPQPHPHRYSAFDTQIFSLNASSSPSQAKRAIEAHIAETNRRLEDAGRLGSALVQQRAELAEKLKEVEMRKNEADLPPELKEKLAEIERDYNDVGRETARALLAPRSRVVSADDRPEEASPNILSSQANASPSKVSVPSRRQRNQPSGRAEDIQFAADISSSLLVQVRQLQAALSERDEALKAIESEKARLEMEAEGFTQRLRAMDESEQRYKDENWNLETQTHEMIAAAKEAAEREKKLSANLAAALAEKTMVQNDLDDVRAAHGKLTEDHTAIQKLHDSEIHSLRRNLDIVDVERDSLLKKIEELTSQNQELVTAIASRSRISEQDADRDLSLLEEDESKDVITPENSPPPSPTKATPRHGALESETLKSSLHHAHRMIQNLKGNIHREKTEKIELKRMLQDARDELEQRRGDGGAVASGSKRQRTKPEVFKKPIRSNILGGNRRAQTDIEINEYDWEDHAENGSPSRAAPTRISKSGPYSVAGNITDFSDAYQTANETEGAFETANERETTESEDFQTGAESLAGETTDESTETETEGRVGRKGTIRASRPSMFSNTAGNRSSYLSTASTSAGEDESDLSTAVEPQPLRYRVRIGRAANGRQTAPKESAISHDSPDNVNTSSPAAEQSLFAELGEFNNPGSDFSTPLRASVFSSTSTPSATPMSNRKSLTNSDHVPAPEPTKMVDSATMTEPWKPDLPSSNVLASSLDMTAGAAPGYSLHGHDLPPPSPSDFPLPPSLTSSPGKPEGQYTPLRAFQDSPNRGMPIFITPPKTIWDEVQDQGPTGSRAQTIPPSPSPPVPISGPKQASAQKPDAVSATPSESVIVPSMVRFSFSTIITQETIPVEPSTPTARALATDSFPSEDESPSPAQNPTLGIGLLSSVGAALGLTGHKQEEPLGEDEPGQSQPGLSWEKSPDRPPPSSDMSGIADSVSDKDLEKSPDRPPASSDMSGIADSVSNKNPEKSPDLLIVTHKSDQGSQTTLTAEEIDDALKRRTTPTPQAIGVTQTPQLKPIMTGLMPRSTSRNRTPIMDTDSQPLLSPMKRPGSSNSSQAIPARQHPPLPADHRNVIAKAGRFSSSGVEFSSAAPASGIGLMGPPVAPASAYRRSRTSAEQSMSSPTRAIIPRPRSREQDRARAGSQMSRQSSFSSFASELDQRFNMRTDGYPANQAFQTGPGADPRMIQAITQTMIGEFLWKYTRKAGRPEMSNTRHKRYFWVHPYTRTLYWSEQDPQTAGGRELKAKSVSIGSVGVVTDDNPMPPGLHRKSLEVVTPGRKIRFTAGTAARHETWFNALSYLIMRGQDDGRDSANAGAMDGGLTAEDVNEFDPGGYGRNSKVSGISGVSLSSYNSQTTRGTNHARASIRQGVSTGALNIAQASGSSASGNVAVTSSNINDGQDDPNRTIRQGSVSRFSHMFKSSAIRDSFSMSRRSMRHSDIAGTVTSQGGHDGGSGIYNASAVSVGGGNSAEELRKEMLRQEREGQGKLENVRACCDGMHDVSDLANSARRRHNHSTMGKHRSRDHMVASMSSRGR